jgi:tetraacyldisaccharide 4'-kinase
MGINPITFHDLVSGRQRGARAGALRFALQLAEPAYGGAVSLRNLAFNAGWRTIHRARVPVISVGNLTTGGTGKTPLVAWIARRLRDWDVRVALVSRGYRATDAARNDEALELELQLPDVPHVQNPDRVAAAQLAVAEFESQLILLDDAFQHRRLYRDLDIVLIDALNPFGFEHLLPRGLLREPLAGLRRAHVVGLSRADQVDDHTRARIWSRIDPVAPDALKIETQFVPRSLRSATGQLQSLDLYGGRPILAFCGIGNPSGFQATLASCDYQLAGFRAFADHHAYQRRDIEQLAEWASGYPGAAALICTEKDLVKIDVPRIGRLPLWALCGSAEITKGRELLERQLQQLAARARE